MCTLQRPAVGSSDWLGLIRWVLAAYELDVSELPLASDTIVEKLLQAVALVLRWLPLVNCDHVGAHDFDLVNHVRCATAFHKMASGKLRNVGDVTLRYCANLTIDSRVRRVEERALCATSDDQHCHRADESQRCHRPNETKVSDGDRERGGRTWKTL